MLIQSLLSTDCPNSGSPYATPDGAVNVEFAPMERLQIAASKLIGDDPTLRGFSIWKTDLAVLWRIGEDQFGGPRTARG